MRPVFYLFSFLDGSDLTANLQDRLISLRVSDQEGVGSDSLEVELDDRGTRIQLPATGERIRLMLGYTERSPIPVIGDYVVDELWLRGPPSSIGFTAKGVDFVLSGIKQPRIDHHDVATLGGLARKLAGRGGFKAIIHSDVDKIQIGHLDQQGESDMGLLQRLALQHDLTLKLNAGQLILRPHASRLAPTKGDRPVGQAPSLVLLDLRNCSTYEWRGKSRMRYEAVRAHYWDADVAKRGSVVVGDESAGPSLTLRHDARDAKQAQALAEARLRQAQRDSASLHLSLPGDTRILAGARLLVGGTTDPVAGLWSIERVEHQLDQAGLTTSLEAVPIGQEAK